MSVHDLPAVNATLNGVAGVLLLIGFVLIRSRNINLHRRFMISAFITSALFLVSYVVYHAQVGSVRFTRRSIRLRRVRWCVVWSSTTRPSTAVGSTWRRTN